jgi:hypothetical protein
MEEQPTEGGPPVSGLGQVLTTPHSKQTGHATKRSRKPRNRTDPSVQAGSCECGNKHSGSIKCVEFPDKLRTC